MTQNNTNFDLEQRTLAFAKRNNAYVNLLPKTITNIENGKQLARSGGSVGANYIEANEALGRKDFFMHIRISRKEAKETRFWLQLTEPLSKYKVEQNWLIQESTEFIKIFTSIISKADSNT